MLAQIREQAEQLHRLIESLLALQRLDAGADGLRISRFPLAGLVQELRDEAEVLNTDRGLTLAWHVPSEACEVETDREKVRAIAYHLLNNAIKFTPAGCVELVATAAADRLVLRVSDTGIGLPPDAHAVIFEVFRQLDGSSTRCYEGLGLGLGIVKRYTTLLGGTVRVHSVPGQGTAIEVVLPTRTRNG
jgi:signal transduction histidine kinase